MAKAQWTAPADYRSRPVCVLGGGVLGRRIAACFVAAGYHVRIRDPSAKSRGDAVDYIKDNLGAFLSLIDGKPTPGTYEGVEGFSDGVKDCWIVVEAIPEILSMKESAFADLETYAPSDCILATNSSSYKSGELLSKVKSETKARVLNIHYMMPPQANIVEFMTSGHTDEAIFPFVTDRYKECGLHTVVALKESTGFVFNRIWAAIKRECLGVLAEGVSTPDVIDAIWKEMYGSEVGPCTLMGNNKVGLDTVEHIEQHYVTERGLSKVPLEYLQKNFIASGKLGDKSDKGGLYPPRAAGSTTKILFLNMGLGKPLGRNTPAEYAHGGEVLELTVGDRQSTGKPVVLVAGQALPDGIDVYGDRMYWTNMGSLGANDGTVQSAKLDGSDIQTVIATGEVHTPKQLCIDQKERKLYFCDREGLRIHRSNLDGSDHEIIIQTGDWKSDLEKGEFHPRDWPVGVTFSHRLNKVFFTLKGTSKGFDGRILSAGLQLPKGCTAANRPDIEVVEHNLPECIDVEFDDESGVLFWTDRGELPLGNTLNRKQIIGDAPASEKALGRQIIAQGLGEGIGLRYDKEDHVIYVTDLSGRLWKCNPNGGPKVKVYEGPYGCYTGLTILKK